MEQKVSMCKFVTKVNETATIHNIKCDQPAYGNVLRIAKRNQNDEYLQLCEVEVYGHKCKNFFILYRNILYSERVSFTGLMKSEAKQ